MKEVYVSSYPDMASRTLVSVRGGRFPVWSRRGGELFYQGPNGLVAVKIEARGDTFSVLDRTALFRTERYAVVNNRNFDVTPDGQSFVLVEQSELRGIWRVGAIPAAEKNP